MSSASSTEGLKKGRESTPFQPWQFFLLAGLAAATAGVFVSRGTSPANVIFISIIIGAAALAGTAVYRMLLPLVVPEAAESAEMIGGRTRAALEREKLLVLRSIKELEFDRAMNKISAQDYDEMVARLRSRAVRLMRQLDAGGSGYREIIERELAGRLGRAAAAKSTTPIEPSETPDTSFAGACVSCGTINESDARFCKHCGSKVVAALVLALAVLMSSVALAQPDLRMMTGVPRPDGNLPDGIVTVRVVRRALANNVTDHPVELRSGDETLTGKTDANGRATFRPPTAGEVLRATTVVDGERLESQEFPAPNRGGVAVMLVAGLGATPPREPARPGTVTIGGDSRFIIDVVDDALQVYYVLEVLNAAPYPVNPSRPLILDLPSGAAGAAALGNSSPQVVVRGDRVTVTGPFDPGVTPVQVGYTMPHSRGNLTISQKLPVEMTAVNVVMRKIGEMALSSVQLSNQEDRTIQGERYVVAAGPAIAADGTLTLELAGLPHHSAVPLTVTSILAAGIVLVGLWVAFARPTRAADAGRRKLLEGRREKAYAELLKLEEQRRAGKVDPLRHQSRKAILVAQLERIYGELDDQGPLTGGDEGLAA
jgi:hypothetical protein